MAKFYFQKDDDSCYTLQFHLEYMRENYIEEMEVFEAKREYVEGYFFCKKLSEVSKSDNCGRYCDNYKPLNGKSGRCIHYGYLYEPIEKSIILHI
jgi:hypothetical protein